jgi:hypothetical protein
MQRTEWLMLVRAQQSVFSDREVWRIASALIDPHEEHASLYALQCVDLSLEVGNFDRAKHWRLVWQATQQLVGTNKPDNGSEN